VHPTHASSSGAMPVLAVGDEGNGRAIALGVDGTWSLRFSELGARTAGRAYGALWDGLLGWLMRDPRFESAQIELPTGCIADTASTLRVRTAGAGRTGEVSLDVRRIDGVSDPIHLIRKDASLGDDVDFVLPSLPAGGYAAVVRALGGRRRRATSHARPAATSGPTRDRIRIGSAISPIPRRAPSRGPTKSRSSNCPRRPS